MSKIKKASVHMLSPACPEQHVFIDTDTGEQIAYLRLRHGKFRVDVPDCGGETIYRANVGEGAGWFSEEEREHYLVEAAKAIAKHYGWELEI